MSPLFHLSFIYPSPQCLHIYLLFTTCLHPVSLFSASSHISSFMFHAVRSCFMLLDLQTHTSDNIWQCSSTPSSSIVKAFNNIYYVHRTCSKIKPGGLMLIAFGLGLIWIVRIWGIIQSGLIQPEISWFGIRSWWEKARFRWLWGRCRSVVDKCSNMGIGWETTPGIICMVVYLDRWVPNASPMKGMFKEVCLPVLCLHMASFGYKSKQHKNKNDSNWSQTRSPCNHSCGHDSGSLQMHG